MKILKKPKLELVTCVICGCVYQQKLRNLTEGYLATFKESVECPICKYKNNVNFIKENNDD